MKTWAKVLILLLCSVAFIVQCRRRTRNLKTKDQSSIEARLAELFPVSDENSLPRILRETYVGNKMQVKPDWERHWQGIDVDVALVRHPTFPEKLSMREAVFGIMSKFSIYVDTRYRENSFDFLGANQNTSHEIEENPHYEALADPIEAQMASGVMIENVIALIEQYNLESHTMSRVVFRNNLMRSAIETSFGYDAGRQFYFKTSTVTYTDVAQEISRLGFASMPTDAQLKQRFNLGRAMSYLNAVLDRGRIPSYTLLIKLVEDIKVPEFRRLFWEHLLWIDFLGELEYMSASADNNNDDTRALSFEEQTMRTSVFRKSGFLAWPIEKQRAYFRMAVEMSYVKSIEVLVDVFGYNPERTDNAGNSVLCDAIIFAHKRLPIPRERGSNADNNNEYSDETEIHDDGYFIMKSAIDALTELNIDLDLDHCAGGNYSIGEILSTYHSYSRLTSYQYMELLNSLGLLPQTIRQNSNQNSSSEENSFFENRLKNASIFDICNRRDVKKFVGENLIYFQKKGLKMANWTGYFSEINRVVKKHEKGQCYITFQARDSSSVRTEDKEWAGSDGVADLSVYYLKDDDRDPFTFRGTLTMLMQWVERRE